MESRSGAPAAQEARPYRSHKFPACSACRQRKGRCDVDDPNLACQYCRRRFLDCDHGVGRVDSSTAKDQPPPAKRARIVNAMPDDVASIEQQAPGVIHESDESSPIMVNPSMAEDVEILERHLATQTDPGASETRPYVRLHSANGESIVYRTVARRRKGLQAASTPGALQLEIIENVIGPLRTDVIKLYFDKIHGCFPILDESSFWSLWRKDPRRISPTLLCDIYAISLPYWHCSEKLCSHQRPDVQFIWNQAVLALRNEFMAPSMATVHAALLDMLGRPIYHITGNIINAGRTVNLAHSQGLHRDPSKWRASTTAKSLRIRVWWALLIHDHWSSLSHGTPPNIVADNYDVPLPPIGSDLDSSVVGKTTQASNSFPHLCWLTKLLGEILPIIYSLRGNNQESWKSIRRTECALDDWLDALPDSLNATKRDHTQVAASSGASGLWFYYLSLKLVLNRLAVKVTTSEQHGETQKELQSYRFALLHRSALNLVDYVASLQEEQFSEFWLPYTAYLLVSAATALLRLLVESDNISNRTEAYSKLLGFLSVLKVARERYGWDLAQLCIEICGQTIEKLAEANSSMLEASRSQPTDLAREQTGLMPEDAITNLEPSQQLNSDNPDQRTLQDDIAFPIDLDIPWDHLWDDIAEPWRFVDAQHGFL